MTPDPSFERTPSASVASFAAHRLWRTARLMIRLAAETLRNACTDS